MHVQNRNLFWAEKRDQFRQYNAAQPHYFYLGLIVRRRIEPVSPAYSRATRYARVDFLRIFANRETGGELKAMTTIRRNAWERRGIYPHEHPENINSIRISGSRIIVHKSVIEIRDERNETRNVFQSPWTLRNLRLSSIMQRRVLIKRYQRRSTFVRVFNLCLDKLNCSPSLILACVFICVTEYYARLCYSCEIYMEIHPVRIRSSDYRNLH